MTDAPLLKIPHYHRSVADALGTASKLDIDNVVILSETDDGVILLSSGKEDLLTRAQILWILEIGKKLLLHPEAYEQDP